MKYSIQEPDLVMPTSFLLQTGEKVYGHVKHSSLLCEGVTYRNKRFKAMAS